MTLHAFRRRGLIIWIVLTILAIASFSQGRSSTSEEEAGQDSALAQFDRLITEAEAAFKSRRWEEAAHAYERAEKVNVEWFRDFRLHLAFVHAQLKQREKGLQELEAFCRDLRESGSQESDCDGYEVASPTGDTIKCSDVRRRLELLPEGPPPAPTAQEIVDRAARAPEVRMRIANARKLAEQAGRTEEALEELEKVLKLEPTNAEAKALKEEVKQCSSEASYQPGQTMEIRIDEIVVGLAWIPAGTFLMGSPPTEEGRSSDEDPQHRVRIGKGFWMMTTEVQQGHWEAVMGPGSNVSTFKKSPTHPMESMSWYEAVDFANKLTLAMAKKNPSMNLKPYYVLDVTKRDPHIGRIVEAEVRIVEGNRGYRLPTEAEWEYACRSNITTPFHFGSTIGTNQANYDWNFDSEDESKRQYRQTTKPAAFFGQAGRNGWGLYDMHGNVEEWCWDLYDEKYYEKCKAAENAAGETLDPQGSTAGTLRVLRGGAWGSDPMNLRSANRYRQKPTSRNGGIGFRLCLDS